MRFEAWYEGSMGRALLLLFAVGWVTGCGGESHGSKPSDAGGATSAGGTGGNSAASTGGNQNEAGAGLAPSAQGAFWVNVKSVSPAPAGKMCPSGASLTFDVPAVTATNTTEALDGDTYLHKVVDGEDRAEVTCTVSGDSTFTLEGSIQLATKSLSIANGTVGANKQGAATITLRSSGSPGFSGSLSSPSPNCVLDAAPGAGNNFQLKPGSIWGHFSCASVEQAPSDYCRAEGYFVLENCKQ